MYLWTSLHHLYFNTNSARRKLVNEVKVIKLRTLSPSIKQVYSQHADLEDLVRTSLRYHLYLIPNNITLTTAYSFFKIGVSA